MYNFLFIQRILTALLVGCLSLLTSCTLNAPKPDALLDELQLSHAYNYILLNQSKQPVTLETVISQLKKADVVVIGEYHGNHASHLLEMQILAGLYRQNPQLLLSMEMFNRDQQNILNDYLDGLIGEAYLVDEAPAWSNYVASYRPLVEFAKSHFIDVIAANASADTVRCIGREGESYTGKLSDDEKLQIARQPFAEIPGYKKPFYDFLEQTRPLPAARKHNSYLAQITRDNTMAESIYQAWLNHPNHQIVHINGTFHSQNHLGTVAALKRLNPNLNIQVITPVHVEEFNGLDKLNLETNIIDEFIYLVKPQPEQYVNTAYKHNARKAQFDKAQQATCK